MPCHLRPGCNSRRPLQGDCSGNAWNVIGTVDEVVWFKPYLAAHFNYLKPAQVTIRGSGDTFRFTSDFDADIFTMAGKVGIPLGRTRIFGQVGMNYQSATFSTSQTNDDVTTTTAEGVTLTAKGGTQTFELETRGWGWSFGGGVEVWLARRFGIYAEASRLRLKGSEIDDGDGILEDYSKVLIVGAPVRKGGR